MTSGLLLWSKELRLEVYFFYCTYTKVKDGTLITQLRKFVTQSLYDEVLSITATSQLTKSDIRRHLPLKTLDDTDMHR